MYYISSSNYLFNFYNVNEGKSGIIIHPTSDNDGKDLSLEEVLKIIKSNLPKGYHLQGAYFKNEIKLVGGIKLLINNDAGKLS
jgi:hypothetical protein